VAGVAATLAHGLTPADQPEKISSDDVDGELVVDERDKLCHGQSAIWVFFEYLHTKTASEWIFDKRGEFFVLVNGVRFPSVGEIFMEKDNVYQLPKPRAIYTEFVKSEKAKCELNIEVRERDLIRDDRLMRFQLNQPFQSGTYRKVITLVGSPITLSVIVKLERNVFCTRAKIVKPLMASHKSKVDLSRKNPSELSLSRAVPDTKEAAPEPEPDATPPPLSPKGSQTNLKREPVV
jgi:hypothetical protein